MAGANEGCKFWDSPTMNGGTDAYSYSKNSSLQRNIGDSMKPLIHDVIAEKLDFATLSFPSTFRIADLGCSVGPNTFFAVQNILEALEKKVQKCTNRKISEIQVFFNDQTSNDFNTLFMTLPKNKHYFVAGVPGSFYRRLFPESSLHLVYSSCAIQWLSSVPKQVLDKNDVAWNKGRIHILNANDEVVSAYSNQSAKDMDNFWQARAQEIVVGGLMIIVLPTRPSGNLPHSEFYVNKVYDTLGSSLEHMMKKGVIDEDKLDSFNVPVYFPSPEEIEESINRSGYFNMERSKCLPHQKFHNNSGIGSLLMAMHIRAALEVPLKEHFGTKIFDELFDVFRKQLEDGYFDIMSREAIDLFIVVRRKSID